MSALRRQGSSAGRSCQCASVPENGAALAKRPSELQWAPDGMGGRSSPFGSASGGRQVCMPRSTAWSDSINLNCLDGPNAVGWRTRAFDGQDWDSRISDL
ncbi:MAG: hypothetical protein ACJA1R_000224 [Flavobacteriales bacterium]|jgi:hypothetical protein